MEFITYLLLATFCFAVGFIIGKLLEKSSGAAALAENAILKNQLEQVKQDHTMLNETFQKEFANIANEILVERTRKVNEDTQKNIATLLSPLQQRLGDFQNRLEQNINEQKKDSGQLAEKIRQLTELNQTVGAEAKRLTEALRGEAKTRGNWGELILEKILEYSGLDRGTGYTLQKQLKGDEGKYRPDVIINLTEGRHLVIDSKLSLINYERFAASQDAEEQQRELKLHIDAMKKHIKDLSAKGYENLEGLKTPDLVFMFVPIEGAFLEAVKFDPELYQYAFDKKIILLSPTTLLASLKLINFMWQQEKQTQNAAEIAEAGANLYDKFVSFVEDLNGIGKNLDGAKNSYEDAMKKLKTGTGNLISRTEKLRKLGVKTKKALLVSEE